MGRKATVNTNLPHRMRARIRPSGRYFYYDLGGKPRKEIPLGSDYVAAVRKWAELEADKAAPTNLITFRYVAEQYLKDILPGKAPRTQKDNLAELAWLYKVFDNPPAPLEDIEPHHIHKYLQWRGKTAKTRANREKALFSHIWNYARSMGFTSKTNPCQGVKGFTEKGRSCYVEDGVFQAIWQAATTPIQDAMDLAYLTGQRPADVLKMKLSDIQDDHISVKQNKTQAKMRISTTGDFAVLIERLKTRTRATRCTNLIVNEDGTPLTYSAMAQRIYHIKPKAIQAHPEMADAIKDYQFRDLRAKAGTDKSETSSLDDAKKQLGHTNVKMTEKYVRDRKGSKVSPTR